MKALEWAQKALEQSGRDYSRDVQAWAVVAIAQQQLGQTNAACAALDKAKETVEARLPKPGSGDLGPDWHDGVISRTLLDEAATKVQQHRESK